MIEPIASRMTERLSPEQQMMVVDQEAVQLQRYQKVEGDQRFSDEELMLWFLTDLSSFAISQADHIYMEDEYRPEVTRAQATRRTVTIAQELWDEIVNYLKDHFDIQIHPLAMLTILHTAVDDGTELSDDFRTAILDQATEILSFEPKEFKTIPVPDIPELNQATDTNALTKEFFEDMLKLGTFHRDRDAYETEDQKRIHDRIIAIYSRLGELIF